MTKENWLMRIEGGLAAHFNPPSGPSRPGVSWTVGLKRGEEVYTVTVMALLTDDATSETGRDEEYQARTTMQYLNDQLNGGWHPKEEKEHTIYIGNPVPLEATQAMESDKPWWKVW